MIHSELCSACSGPLQLGVGLVIYTNKKFLKKFKNFLVVYLCRFIYFVINFISN